jgi:segregation and condensation protein A
MTAYEIELPVFQGPLDLLLHLIERQELDISVVSLARVTEQYLQYLARAEQVDAAALADFLAIAARLVWIKSRLLLPQPPAAEETEEAEEDPGESLARQLRVYKQFKAVAEALRQREQQGLRSYVRLAATPAIERRLDVTGLSVLDLAAAMQRVLAEAPILMEKEMVRPFLVTIHDKIALACRLLQQQPELRFRHLLAPAIDRVDVVVSLLAVLELVKRRQITVEQPELFGEILIRPALGADLARTLAEAVSAATAAAGVADEVLASPAPAPAPGQRR